MEVKGGPRLRERKRQAGCQTQSRTHGLSRPTTSSRWHLTASSSAIAEYYHSRITLHGFNSAAAHALLLDKCGAPGADGSRRFSETAACGVELCHFTVGKAEEWRPSLFCGTQRAVWTGPAGDRVQSGSTISVFKFFFLNENLPQDRRSD